MRAIALSLTLASLLAQPGNTGAHAEIVNVFGSVAAALADDNVPGFMKRFDREMPGYGDLGRNVAALIQVAEVTSAAEVIQDDGDESKRAVAVDWYLDIRSRAAAGPYEQRRKVVHCQLRKEDKGWRITALKPVDFFAAPHY